MREVRRRRSVSQAFLLDLLAEQLTEWQRATGRANYDVVDLGGGTGGFAKSLAEQGHTVLVIDPSPDALASLERRTAEAGLSERIRGLQGDASDMVDLVGPEGADVLVCHRVLEVVDSPADALASMAAVLRPGGVLSLAVTQRRAAVLSQALAGHIDNARRVLADPARFDLEQVSALVLGAGLEIVYQHGIGAIAEHVPESLIDAESGIHAELYALESEISQDPAFRALAPLLHIFARRPDRDD